MARRKRTKKFKFIMKQFPKRMQKKLVMLFMAIILAFVVLLIRITYINASKGSNYTRIVLDQQAYDSRTIPYMRGDIVDRNGTKLATNERIYNVILDIYVMTAKEQYIEPSIRVLQDVFGIDGGEIRTLMAEKPDSRYEILAKEVSYEKAREFKAIVDDRDENPDVRGIWLEESFKRTYPYHTLASDVIGFSVSGNLGTIGIESAYNEELNGIDGREYGFFAAESTLERTVKPAKNGNTVVSTIDVTVQSIVEQAIREFNEAHAGEARPGEPGSKNTAVIVMNPNTGEILALASYPNFDLNKPRDLSVLYSEEQIGAMSDEERLNALNALWRNFCVSDAYEPGSTAKPFTVAAGLETGTITGEEAYYCDGGLEVGDYTINCHLLSGHGMQTVQDAVANSCNVALMDIAFAVGIENYSRYQHVFGFGEETGVDLPGEEDTSSLLYTAENMQITDLATNSFGQNFNVTMLQMTAGFSSLINGGNYYQPHVVKQIRDDSGRVVETKDPVLLRKTVSEDTSAKIRQYLKAVMEYGTGMSANVEGYDVGGKTGTAEKLPRNQGNHLLSYIGYAPQDHPEVVVYVVIDEPNVADQDNSAYIKELSQRIMAQIFPYLNITK